MKKLHLYMLKSYLGPFVFTFFVALFILLLQFLWKYLDDLVGKGLEWIIIGKLMFYASSTFVPLALPLAILLSSLMTFGNLGENYELVAMKSAGISLRKAMKPLVILAVFLSLAAFYFSNYVLPIANLKFGSLLYDVRQQKLAFNLNEGIFNDGLDDIVIYVGKKDKDNKTIYDVKIYDHTERKGNVKVVSAKKGIMELSPDQQKIIFTLFEGSRYTEITDQAGYREKRPFEVLAFKKFIRVFDLSEFKLNRTDEDLFRSHYTMLNIKQLNKSIDSLSQSRIDRLDHYKEKFVQRLPYLAILRQDSTIQKDSAREPPVADTLVQQVVGKSITDTVTDTVVRKVLHYPLLENYALEDQAKIVDLAMKEARNTKDNIIFYKDDIENRQQVITKHEVVWHQKFKLSLACLIFFFIGAPLGAIIRKGGLGLPVVVSVVFFVIYHIISMTGEKAAKTGEWDVIFGSWLSTVLILPLGLLLTYKATTDAPLLDAESWKRSLQKFRRKVFRKRK
ncbi:MAG: LptF/LptG family permease [bacterium]|jgi:lipopolysaccharide export system permease protein